MINALVLTHTVVGLLVLLTLLAVGGYALLQVPRRPVFRPRPFALAVVLLDIQVTLGILTYLLEKGWHDNPFIAVIHPFTMLVVLGLLHVVVGRARRRPDPRSFRTIGFVFLLAFVLAALAVPWQRVTGNSRRIAAHAQSAVAVIDLAGPRPAASAGRA